MHLSTSIRDFSDGDVNAKGLLRQIQHDAEQLLAKHSLSDKKDGES